MASELVLHPSTGAPVRATLSGPATAGGSHADRLHVPGLPPAAVRLEPCAAGVIVAAAAPGVRAGGHPVPPGARRLLRPGERAEVLGAILELPPPADGTRVAAAALLRDAAAGDPAPPAEHLVVLTGPAAGRRLPLGPVQVLGRSRSAELRLADPLASRRHARLRVEGGAVTVEDLGAKNGVRVNGVPVDRRRARLLAAGDELGIGETVLALVVPGAPAGRPAGARSRPRHGRRARRRPRPLVAAVLLAASAAALLAAAA